SAIGTEYFDTLQAHNDPTRPMLCVLAHDGDNAWGGGYSYYMEAVPNLVSASQAAGYTATVVEQYLADYPVPIDDVIKVEDGAWVNADGDFGSPLMLNWNWPPVNGSGQVDIEGGWAEDIRNWAVITAAQNRVETAEQIAGGVDIDKILYPDGATSPAERAWHYFLGALNSGYMYYGAAEDMEVKPTIACNEAVQHADIVIGDGSADQTGPTIWLPQRHPWNPGSLNFGPQYGYQVHNAPADFYVWSFLYDVSGIQQATLKVRVDGDGVNPLDSTQNETYAGGTEVGPWQSIDLTQRDFPMGNIFNDPNIDFFEMPTYSADQYHAQVTGFESVLVDYYIEAVDGRGNVTRSPIQHVYIGDGSGSGGGDVVTVDPDPPVAGENVTITYDPVNRPLQGADQVYLHYGFNGWAPVIDPDVAMTWDGQEEWWVVTVPVLNSAWQLDIVFNDGQGNWDNNSGQDWHFMVQGGGPGGDWVMDGVLDADAALLAENGPGALYAGLKGEELYVAAPDAGEGDDHFICLALTPGPMQPAMWAKVGQVARWDAFLADENDNDYSAWFDAAAATAHATGANGGVLEGTINLVDQYGDIPDIVPLAFLPYATADGGALQGHQAPASSDGDGDVEAVEYLAVDLCALKWYGREGDVDGDGDVDQSDLGLLLASYLVDDGGDLNCDGLTDQSDLGILLAHYGG
ncbi:MAG: carbohydrate-binding protein, partial [Phycisphaerales bacterium JB038]